MVVLNGQVREFAARTLAELVAELGLKADRVAVERNGEIAARGNWDAVELAEGDKIEVVHFVGGGTPSPPIWAKVFKTLMLGPDFVFMHH